MSAWTPPVQAAFALYRELAKLGVDSALHAGVSPPAVSVWGGIVVRVGETFSWINSAQFPAQYASVPADQPQEAARQVAARHAELVARRQHAGVARTAVPS